MADMIYPGTASPADVLTGKKFSAGTNYNADGTMPNQGSPTFTPNGNIQTGAAGYYGGVTVDAVAVKVTHGTATSGAQSTFDNYGGGTSTLYTLTVPVPAGATEILAVVCTDTANITNTITGMPEGYADGTNSTVLMFMMWSGSWWQVISGGSLSISTSSIVLGSNGSATFNYTVFYV